MFDGTVRETSSVHRLTSLGGQGPEVLRYFSIVPILMGVNRTQCILSRLSLRTWGFFLLTLLSLYVLCSLLI
jgi:hypothetical protein